MSQAKWVDLSRFGAKLELVKKAGGARQLRLLIQDTAAFEDAVAGAPFYSLSKEKASSTLNAFRQACNDLGLMHNAMESERRSELAGQRSVVYYSDDTQITFAKLKALVPPLLASDFVDVHVLSPFGEPFLWQTDEAVQQQLAATAAHIGLDVDSGQFQPLPAGAAPKFYVPDWPSWAKPRLALHSVDAIDQGFLIDFALLKRLDMQAESTAVEVWTTAQSCADCNGIDISRVREIELPFAAPVASNDVRKSVVVLPDLRVLPHEPQEMVSRFVSDAAQARAQARMLAQAAVQPAQADLHEDQVALEVTRAFAQIFDGSLPPREGYGLNHFSPFGGMRAARLQALVGEYRTGQDDWIDEAIANVSKIDRLGASLMRDALDPDAKAEEATSFRALVEPIVTAAVDDDMWQQEAIYQRVRAGIDNRFSASRFMGTYECPQRDVGYGSRLGEEEFSRICHETFESARHALSLLPAGAWLVIKGASTVDHPYWYGLMSLGNGEVSKTTHHAFHQPQPPTQQEVEQRALSALIEEIRADVRVRRAKEQNELAMSLLLEQGLHVTQEAKNVSLGNIPFTQATVTSIDVEAGKVHLTGRVKGRRGQTHAVEVDAEALAHALGIKLDTQAYPLWKLTRANYFKDPARVRKDVLGPWQKDGVLLSFEYVSSKEAGLENGKRYAPSADWRIGSVFQAPFGTARITAIHAGKDRELSELALYDLAKALHERAVKGALADGQRVPAAVLADYPHLAAPLTLSETPEQPSQERKGRIEDVGEKIGGARKDFYARRLSLNDLADMNDLEKTTLVNKHNIWPKLDYAAMRAEGVQADAAYAVKWIKDKINVQCTQAVHAEAYVQAVCMIRDALSQVKTMDDFKRSCKELVEPLRELRYNGAIIGKHLIYYMDCQYQVEYVARARTCNGKDWGKLIKEAPQRKRVKDEEGPSRPQRPHLAHIERKGFDYREGRDVSGEDLMQTFGFRAIEYGNWLPQDERQTVLNFAYDAFRDLARATGLPIKAMSLNGELALAFGARGKGRAAAHFEPARMVCNLTRLNGAGALAHEFGHALDRYLAIDGHTRHLFLSEGAVKHDLPADIHAVYTLMEGLETSKIPLDEGMKNTMQSAVEMRDRALRNITGFATYGQYAVFASSDQAKAQQEQYVQAAKALIEETFAKIDAASMQLDPKGAHDAFKAAGLVDKLADAYREHGGTHKTFLQGSVKSMNAWQGEMLSHLSRVAQLERLKEQGVQYMPKNVFLADSPLARGVSAFMREAKTLDAGRSKKYFSDPKELFARAFEAYVFDALKQEGVQSDYLVHGVEEDRYTSKTLYIGNPYPAGEERQRFNQAFSQAFEMLAKRFEAEAEKTVECSI